MKAQTKKLLIAIVSVLILITGTIGITLAWFTDKTPTIQNTFTVGNINIKLEETERTYKMVPGYTLPKDPTVTVVKGSVDCWLFIKIDKSANLDSFIDYTIATGWTQLEAGSNVYYREVANDEVADQSFAVLKDNQVTVKTTVTKEMVDALTGAEGQNPNPTLSFTAYAIQKYGFNTAALAWTEVSTTTP